MPRKFFLPPPPHPKNDSTELVNYHQLTKTETSCRTQLDLTIESMQQSIETHII